MGVGWIVAIVAIAVLVEMVKLFTGEMLQQSSSVDGLTVRTTMPDAFAVPLEPVTWLRLML